MAGRVVPETQLTEDEAAQQGAEADKVRDGVCVRGPCSLAPVLGGPKGLTMRARLAARITGLSFVCLAVWPAVAEDVAGSICIAPLPKKVEEADRLASQAVGGDSTSTSLQLRSINAREYPCPRRRPSRWTRCS